MSRDLQKRRIASDRCNKIICGENWLTLFFFDYFCIVILVWLIFSDLTYLYGSVTKISLYDYLKFSPLSPFFVSTATTAEHFACRVKGEWIVPQMSFRSRQSFILACRRRSLTISLISSEKNQHFRSQRQWVCLFCFSTVQYITIFVMVLFGKYSGLWRNVGECIGLVTK